MALISGELGLLDPWMCAALGPIDPVMALVGALAGLITTVAGMGGGMTLLLALSLLSDPHAALAVTAPALLIGNAQRLWMFRASLDRPLARALVLGALPGSLLGGLLAVQVPSRALHLAMAVMAALAVLKAVGRLRVTPGAGLVGPVGFGTGVVCAGAGGAGLLIGPTMLAAGLSGEAYVATNAAGAVAMHLGRLAGYSAGGMVGADTLVRGAVLALAIMTGNLAGRHARRWLTPRRATWVETGAVVLCVALAAVGAGA